MLVYRTDVKISAWFHVLTSCDFAYYPTYSTYMINKENMMINQ